MTEASPRGVVCFGEALIDFLVDPKCNSKADPCFVGFGGGAPANVAVAVARLGGASAYIGMLANDRFGDFLLGSLNAAGVNTQGVVRTDAARTALAFIELEPDGEPSFSFYRPPSADLLFRERHFRSKSFADCAIFHVCSNSLTDYTVARATLAGVRRAQEAGALVSCDLNFRRDLWPKKVDPRPRLWRLLRHAHLVKLSAEELAFLSEPLGGEEEVFQCLWKGVTKLAMVTSRARSIRLVFRHCRESCPAFALEAVDSTAAGDAFIGGFLHWLCAEGIGVDTLADNVARLAPGVRVAAACGAIAASRYGAYAAMPSRNELESFLRAHR